MQKPPVLKLNKEFKRAYDRGAYQAGPLLVTYMVRTGLKQVRYGITTGKKIGCAVARNRARRLIRTAFWQLYEQNGWAEAGKGVDFVFVAREKTPSVKSTDIYRAMDAQIRSLLKKEQGKKKQ